MKCNNMAFHLLSQNDSHVSNSVLLIKINHCLQVLQVDITSLFILLNLTVLRSAAEDQD